MTASASFPAFGSTAMVMASDAGHLSEAVAATERVVASFDAACSRFRADSELSVLNRAAGRTMRVSPLLGEALGAGLRAAQLTDGDVDPTLGRALIALGYDRDFDLGLAGRGAGAGSGAVQARLSEASLRFAAVPGWRALRLDGGAVTVPEGVSVDLGATAKALAADHAARAAHQAAGTGVLVGFGGDLATAGPAPEDGWLIRVTDDHRAGPDAPGQTITIASGGLATSSTTTRRWRTGGEDRHHLLDPATGRPVDSIWRTVSVAAASCLDANIASTAAIIRGERAVGWLEAGGLPARLVSTEGWVRHLAGWPGSGDDLAPLNTQAALA